MHEGHRNRKREHALKCGFGNMETHEILEMLLYYSIPRSDTNPIAHNLINRFGGFDKVLEADYGELLEVQGVGDKTVFLIKLLPEIIRRYELSKTKKVINVGIWQDLENYVKSLFAGTSVEQFYCICLSAGRNIVSTRMLHSGFADHIDVPYQIVIKEAIARGVNEIVIAHNHPYGSLRFSEADITYTDKLKQVLDVMDINLVDHFVVKDDECQSFFKSCT